MILSRAARPMHHRAKLTPEAVQAMRRDFLPYVRSYGWLALKYGCGKSTARDIVQYRTRLSEIGRAA